MDRAEWLSIVAEQHDEWVKIVKSFGEKNFAEDIVMESYIALTKYAKPEQIIKDGKAVSYTHLRAHETRHDLVCRLLLEKKNF